MPDSLSFHIAFLIVRLSLFTSSVGENTFSMMEVPFLVIAVKYISATVNFSFFDKFLHVSHTFFGSHCK